MKLGTRVNIIQGKPIYIYKGKQYIDKPEKTVIRKMYWNKDVNVTFVKCVKKSKKFEAMCVLVILTCTALSLFTPTSGREFLYYSRVVDYYDGNYYMNVENSEASLYGITCVVLSGDEEISRSYLMPGEKWVTAKGKYFGRDIKLYLEYDYPILKRYDVLNVSVVNRDGSLED